ncbi:MAG: hypothetical protein CL610_07605 [Anaerolineaceae bacterium]|nr:hypothetical protein [Anaerolineaceae bacterium]
MMKVRQITLFSSGLNRKTEYMFDVAIQIVTHNHAPTIQACLLAVNAQQHVTYSVHLLDNASTDSTVEHIRTLGYEVFCSPHNLGYSAAHNQLLEQGNSRYVLTLNPDAILQPDFLYHMVHALDQNPKAGAAAGCLLRIEGPDDEPSCIDGAGLMMQRNRRQYLRCEGQPVNAAPRQMEPIFGPDGAAAFYRRAMLDDIQVMDEVFDNDFFMHKEDVDICWRAQLRGWSALYVPDAVGYHIRTFRAGQRANIHPAIRRHAVRNRYLLMLKNEQWRHFLVDLIPILFYDAKIIAYLLFFERSSLHAFIDLLRLLPRMRVKRRLIQQGRRTNWQATRLWFEH